MKTPIQEIQAKMNELGELHFCDWLGGNIQHLLEKEKEVMVDFAYKCRNVMAADEFAITHWYTKTFKTKER